MCVLPFGNESFFFFSHNERTIQNRTRSFFFDLWLSIELDPRAQVTRKEKLTLSGVYFSDLQIQKVPVERCSMTLFPQKWLQGPRRDHIETEYRHGHVPCILWAESK